MLIVVMMMTMILTILDVGERVIPPEVTADGATISIFTSRIEILNILIEDLPVMIF